MLRFALGRIPVTVHASHLVIAALFGWMWVTPGRDIAVPLTEELVARAGSGEYAKWATLAIVGWMVIIFVSVLAHELGHALASRAFGFQPAIHLAWLGGHTETGIDLDLAWFKRVAIILAGPVAGALAGLVAGVIALVIDAPPFIDYLLIGMALANAFWAILNLLPVAPLDGSQIALTVAMRMFGRRGFVLAHGLGLVAGALLAFWFFKMGALIGMIIFGLGALQAWQAIAAYRRGEVVGTPEATHALAALERAQRALKAGDLETARREASALQSDAPEAILSRGHHLLGWVALQEENGTLALEHFAQVKGSAVEPEALAMAYSLVGDDRQAASLWELVYRERKSSKAAESWAASLLLHDGSDTRVGGVEPAGAHLAASRIAFRRGQFARAAELAERSLQLSPSEQAAYEAACARAQLGQLEPALALLAQARELGFEDLEHARQDPDLAPLRAHPGFDSWLAAGPVSPGA